MQQPPKSLRPHVVLLGETNAGKSSLFNALAGQQAAIVSSQPGTTTDPVQQAMELIPFGPIVLVDTAGSGDDSLLGSERQKKTAKARRRADVVLFVADAANFRPEAYEAFLQESQPHILVFTKGDLISSSAVETLLKRYPAAVVCNAALGQGLAVLREKLGALLCEDTEEQSLTAGVFPPGSNVVLVTPIDSAAPKGRLILPQVQLLRDCLDNGITCMVCREFELESALATLNRVDFVVTDSQAFAYVNQRVPRDIPLTSFSMLLARQKGNFGQLLAGAAALDTLPDGAKILMLEGCTHNTTHEDIGRVKIPALLRKKTGKSFEFSFCSGYDFPADLSSYHMAIQCGGCMLNKREITSRLRRLAAEGLPVTNYGICLAWGSGILDRCCEIFNPERAT